MNNLVHDTDSHHLSTLLQISSTLNSSLDLDVVLTNAMNLVVELLKAERGFIQLIEGDRLILKAYKNCDPEKILQGEEISTSVIENVVATHAPVVTINAMSDSRFSSQESVVAYKLRSVLCVPLLNKNTLTGIIYIDNRMKSGVFTEKDLHVLTAFANHAASAIENARLYENLKGSIDEKLKLQEEILLERAQKQIQLERNTLKEELAHYLVHDLRNPLTAVYSAFGILDMSLQNQGTITQEERGLLEKSRQNLRMMSSMISDILDVYLLENNQLELEIESVDLCALVRAVFDTHRGVCRPEVQLRSEFETEPVSIRCDRNIMTRVLNNLVHNACKVTESGYIETAVFRRDPGEVMIEIRDTGTGVPDAMKDRLFSKFVRIETRTKIRQSRGLGLAFCRLAVQAHGGEISVHDNPPGGTIMQIRLPVQN